MTGNTKKVLIVDDSPVVRSLLKHIIESDGGFQVVGMAGDGLEAIELARSLRPDVITMDVQMPRMQGTEAIRNIMRTNPTPILLCSVLAVEGAPVVLDALKSGAVDFVTKPKNYLGASDVLGQRILTKLKAVASANLETLGLEGPPEADEEELPPLPSEPDAGSVSEQDVPPAGEASASDPAPAERPSTAPAIEVRPEDTSYDVVLLAGSTGAARALTNILPELPPGFPAAVLVAVQDMQPVILNLMVTDLGRKCRLPVELLNRDSPLERGKIHVLSGEAHAMMLRAGAGELPSVRIMQEAVSVGEQVPSLNGIFSSLAVACPGRAVGVLLTGMGKDGALGLKKLKKSGSLTIAEDRSTAVIFEKPEAAIALNVVDRILPYDEIGEALFSATQAQTADSSAPASDPS